MDEQNDDWTRPQQPMPRPAQEPVPQPAQQTTPYDFPLLPPAAQAPAAPAPARGRKGFAAAVLTGALVLGGAGGLGGAALWTAYDDESAATAGGTGSPAVATQVATTDDDAPAGSVEAVAAGVLPSVVKIDVVGRAGSGSGSGIVLTSDGQILTNEHVVSMATEGDQITVSFSDGRRAPAEVLGTDPLTDTAVIQAQDVDGLTVATIGESGALDVGEQVVAIGSPFGLESTVTTGIVSALDRPVNVGTDDENNSTTYPAIQTDAAINPGNSGGPLVNMDGQVIGINSSIRTASVGLGGGSGGSIGLGFAIPIDEVLPIVEQMANGETPTHARLGITVSDPGAPVSGPGGIEGPDPAASDVVGAEVQEVGADSAAGEAGIEDGDVITRVDDRPVTGADSLVAIIRSYRPGDEVSVTFVRDGEEQTVELELDSDASSGE
ncbi:S1C family serine protease [Nocardioides sp. SYSU DS0663]|uniref:S1C family serine protease n=1 Tax=Nocardioides sp. SYSU DS0663 TaxID=3416445 RepID=UPI003F4C5D1A